MVAAILSLRTARGEVALAQTTRDLRRDLARSDVSVKVVERPSQPGERGDAFTLGQLAVDLVTSGTVTALLECLKAYLARDKTLSLKLSRPDDFDIEMTSRNIDGAELLAQLKSLVNTK